MFINCIDPMPDSYVKLGEDYYNESKKHNGSNVFEKTSLKRIRSQEYSEVLRRVDRNYDNAMRDLALVYDGFSKLISLRGDNWNIIAHTILAFNVDEATGELKPYIKDIIIPDGDKFINDSASGIRIKSNIYRKIIEFYENIVTDYYPSCQEWNIQTYGNDGELWVVLADLGYEVQDSGDLESTLLRFTKQIRERKASDGGNITRQ